MIGSTSTRSAAVARLAETKPAQTEGSLAAPKHLSATAVREFPEDRSGSALRQRLPRPRLYTPWPLMAHPCGNAVLLLPDARSVLLCFSQHTSCGKEVKERTRRSHLLQLVRLQHDRTKSLLRIRIETDFKQRRILAYCPIG